MQDPKSDLVSGYHLFLLPEAEATENFSRIIQKLSGEFGSPLFTPHVTLLAEIPAGDEVMMREKTAQLAASGTFSLTVAEFGMQDAYYRALFAAIALTPELETLRSQAERLFEFVPETPFMPHLSLLYGNYPAQQKREALATLERVGGMSFPVGSLALYRTEGTVSNWKEVAVYQLS